MNTKTHSHAAGKKDHTGPIDWRRLVEWLHADGVISEEQANKTIARCALTKGGLALNQSY